MTDQDIKTLAEVEARSNSNTKRLDEVERRIENNDKMLTTVALIAQKQDTMDVDLKEIKTDVKELALKPGKRWEGIVDKIIYAFVGGLVTYILFRIGLGI